MNMISQKWNSISNGPCTHTHAQERENRQYHATKNLPGQTMMYVFKLK